MRIGVLAEEAGVSTKAIRYYEAIGVLPSPDRTPSGYRAYTPDAVERLRFVRSAQAIGLTLGEIREVLNYRDRGEAPCAQVVELIRRRATEIDQQITQLETMRTELRHLERRARTLRREDCPPSEVCHVIPRA